MPWMEILTHLAALSVGWACVDRWMVDFSNSSNSGITNVRTSSAERRPTGRGSNTARHSLARWTGNTPDPVMVERLGHGSVAEIADSIFEKWAGMDVGSIVHLLAERKSGEFKFMLYEMRELLLADPTGMRDWYEELPWDKRQNFTFILNDAGLASAIPDEQIDSWEGIGSQQTWLVSERGRRAGRKGDLTSLSKTLEEIAALPGSRETSASLSETIANWPVDRVNELVGKLGIALSRARPGVARLLARLPADDRMAFLDSITAHGGAQNQDPILADLRMSAAYSAIGMNPEERLNLIKPSNNGQADNYIPLMVRNDITRLFTDETLPDGTSLQSSLDKIRKGEMKATDLLDQVSSRLGSLAEGRENLVKEHVFQQLARIAPDAAVTLVEGSPAKSVQEMVFSLGLDPAGFESAASILRAREPEVPDDLHSRFSGWGHKSFEGLARYGDAYVSWAMAMPRSLERDLALSAIAIHLDKDDPQWAARLRAEKTYQSGWKPGMK